MTTPTNNPGIDLDDEYAAPKVCVSPLATRPVLYTDTVGGEQTCRDDLWAITTDELNYLHNTIKQAKIVDGIQAATIQRLRDQQDSLRPDFLLNGTRFKLNFSTRGNVDVFHNYAAELQGRWVALVPAEDDAHLARQAAPVAPTSTQQHTARDWNEDAAHENGNYQCVCSTCGHTFIGHKRRVTCKACAADPYDTPLPAIEYMAKQQRERVRATTESASQEAQAAHAGAVSVEQILKIVVENTGKRISLSLNDLDCYIAVAHAAIATSEPKEPQA